MHPKRLASNHNSITSAVKFAPFSVLCHFDRIQVLVLAMLILS